MLTQGDLGVHTKELDVATVKFSGAKAVEALIVELTKSLSPCRVFPYPLIKSSLDLLLLTLCDCGFLFVEDLFLVSVLINGIVKDTHVLEVQGFFYDLITVDSMSTVSVCRLDVSSVSCLIGYDPLGGLRNEFNLDKPSHIERCTEKFVYEILNILLRYP